MKRYGQRCSVARALDVVGDRWSLLVIRELMVGPRRYTDLQHGLPGVGTNILSARLHDLAEAGVLTKRQLPPPAAVAVYELTDAGRALAPVLAALRGWGARYAPAPEAGDAVRPAWVLMSANVAPARLAPGKVCEVVVDGESFQLSTEASGFAVRSGSAQRPDAVVTLPADALYALVVGIKAPGDVSKQATIAGDRQTASEVLEALYGSQAPRRHDDATSVPREGIA